jgi:hypothetical protein
MTSDHTYLICSSSTSAIPRFCLNYLLRLLAAGYDFLGSGRTDLLQVFPFPLLGRRRHNCRRGGRECLCFSSSSCPCPYWCGIYGWLIRRRKSPSMSRSRGHGWRRRSILDDDDFPQSTIAVQFLHLTIANSILVCAFAFAGRHGWSRHCAWTRVGIYTIQRMTGVAVCQQLWWQLVHHLHRLDSCERRGG